MKFFLFFLFLLTAQVSLANNCESKNVLHEYKPKYAKYFTVRFYSDFKLVELGKKPDLDRFIIADKKLDCETQLSILKSNTNRFVATSTTYLPILKMLNLQNTLVGFAGVNHISSLELNQKIKNINYQLNPEELLALKPDLVMAYSGNLVGSRRAQDLRKLNIPVVLNYDFQESHPLARAEWMIFTSLFFEREKEAQAHFLSIEKKYNELKTSASQFIPKKVLVGDIQSGKWVTCGGKSDLAILIRDAGAELVIETPQSETQYISLEKLVTLKSQPEIWLSQNSWKNLSVMKKDSRYRKFTNLKVYNNNKLLNSHGFNDFWETGISRPDLLLEDLINIFHNQSKSSSNLTWYQELR